VDVAVLHWAVKHSDHIAALIAVAFIAVVVGVADGWACSFSSCCCSAEAACFLFLFFVAAVASCGFIAARVQGLPSDRLTLCQGQHASRSSCQQVQLSAGLTVSRSNTPAGLTVSRSNCQLMPSASISLHQPNSMAQDAANTASYAYHPVNEQAIPFGQGTDVYLSPGA
jgi:uncharacterized membrane protein